MLFYIYILYFLLVFIYFNLHLHLYFYIFVLGSYCNAQLKIYIDNCAIEINKIIIIIIITALSLNTKNNW